MYLHIDTNKRRSTNKQTKAAKAPMLLFAHWYIVWRVFHQCVNANDSMILRFIYPLHIHHIHFTIWAFIWFYTHERIIILHLYVEYLWRWCNSWLLLFVQCQSNQIRCLKSFMLPLFIFVTFSQLFFFFVLFFPSHLFLSSRTWTVLAARSNISHRISHVVFLCLSLLACLLVNACWWLTMP